LQAGKKPCRPWELCKFNIDNHLCKIITCGTGLYAFMYIGLEEKPGKKGHFKGKLFAFHNAAEYY
jgi:hypothetical protein